MFTDDERHNHFLKSARSVKRGMAAEQIVPGSVVTISPCKSTGDRSYIGAIWEVVGSNDGSVVLKWLALDKPYSAKGGDQFLWSVQRHEREFYPAEHLLDAVKPA